MEPASIRYKNPGAMWGNALAIKWGADPHPVTLNDGKGQGNNIAVFPTFVQGICAQLDLWRTSKNYRNKTFADAIAIWSGHNEVPSYILFCKKRVPGLTETTVLNDNFWKSSMAIPFLKAQAGHEAGKTYPAPDNDWIVAQQRVMASPHVPIPASPTKKAIVTVTATAAPLAPAAAHSSGMSGLAIFAIFVLAAAVGGAVWYYFHRRQMKREGPAFVNHEAVLTIGGTLK